MNEHIPGIPPQESVTDVPPLFPRDIDAHKNELGRVFVLAGCRTMIGAAYLSAESVLRSGAGYCCLGLPVSLVQASISNPRLTCVLTEALPESSEGFIGIRSKDHILELCENYDVIAIGPGLSTDTQTQKLIVDLLPELERGIVLDADALTALARQGPGIYVRLRRGHGLPVLTPHPGEFARLAGIERAPIEHEERVAVCRKFAYDHEVVCVLKGHRTVVSDGKRVYTNTTGNPGMATAGSGDVLTGVIAALRAQGYDSFEAAVLGVYLHGMAGDLVAERVGQWGMTALDLVDGLPPAFMRHERDRIAQLVDDSKENRRSGRRKRISNELSAEEIEAERQRRLLLED